MVTIIAAIQEKDNAIGKDNGLLFSLPADLKHFKELTMGHPVIMGRKTYESLPERFRPLPGRTNVVVTTNTDLVLPDNVIKAHSLEEAVTRAKKIDDTVFIIGGGKIYAEAFKTGLVERLELTIVKSDAPGTVFFPEWKDFGILVHSSEELISEEGLLYTFITIEKK